MVIEAEQRGWMGAVRRALGRLGRPAFGPLRSFMVEPVLVEAARLGWGQSQLAGAVGRLGADLAALQASQAGVLARIEAAQAEAAAAHAREIAALHAAHATADARMLAAFSGPLGALREAIELSRERLVVGQEIGHDRLQLLLERVASLEKALLPGQLRP
jgi:hypothetical protein